jgi:transposase
MVHRTRDLLVRQRTAAVNALRGHLAEFGIIAAKGTTKARELMSLVGTDERVPAIARDALLQLVKQIRNTQGKIEAFGKQILSLARKNEVCRRFDERADHRAVCHHRIDGDGRQSSLVRLRSRLCSWLGLVPKQYSTGGRERLGGISKRGDTYLRKLLMHGARAAAHRVRGHRVSGAWIAGPFARRHFNIATVALMNETARIVAGNWSRKIPPPNYYCKEETVIATTHA